MTLQCECGGVLELTSQSYDRDSDGNITGKGAAFEAYECASCGQSGTYTFGEGTDRMSGCVTTDY